MPALKIAVTAACLNRPLRETLIAAAEIGVQGIVYDVRTELRPGDLSDTGRRQFLKMASEMNLAVAALSFASRRPFYEADDLDRRIAAAKAAMDFAYQLGARILTLRVGRVPTDPESPEYLLLRDGLNDIARHGNHVGVAIAIAPTREGTSALSTLLRDVTAGPVGVDFDPPRLLFAGQSPVAALRELHQWIFHVRARDGLQETDGSGIEVPLGRGEIDWMEFVATLDEIGYGGWITVDRTQGENRAADAARAIKYLRNIEPQ